MAAPQKSFLGIDLGGKSIKIVELKEVESKPQLATYGFIELFADTSTNFIDNPEKTAETIKEIIKKAKTTTTKAIAALPAPSVFNSIISLPSLTKKDLASDKKISAAVKYEAKKVVPLPLDEMVLDWKILSPQEMADIGSDDKKITNLQVLLTGAAKTLIKKYMELFKKSGLEILSLETESFALIRSLVGKDKALLMVLDVGATNTDLAIVENGIPVVERSIGTGGFAITQAISQSLRINLDQAEQLKKDLENANLNGAGNNSVLIPPSIAKVLEPVINEIKYTINFYQEQPENKGKFIEKIVLTGGSALFYNLANYLSQILDIRVFIGDPWARVVYPEPLQPVLHEIGPRYACAVGLAMRDIVE